MTAIQKCILYTRKNQSIFDDSENGLGVHQCHHISIKVGIKHLIVQNISRHLNCDDNDALDAMDTIFISLQTIRQTIVYNFLGYQTLCIGKS